MTERLLLRNFSTEDWPAVQALAIDWQAAPGPAFDKLPTTAEECQQLTAYLATGDHYLALCRREENQVIGLLALNGLDEQGRFDLGHIIHSRYQDNDLDREAIAAVVTELFADKEVATIVTHNADHAAQLAPLRTLGFQPGDPAAGELLLTRAMWMAERFAEHPSP